MSQSKNVLKVMLALVSVVAMSGCGKTKNSGTAKTSSSACTVKSDGTIRRADGTLCTSGSAVCPSRGWYLDEDDRRRSCEPGERININDDYPYSHSDEDLDGCRMWTEQYDVLYVPMLLDGQLVCANYEWLSQYAGGSSYYNNFDDYYSRPPYGFSGDGGSCKKGVKLKYEDNYFRVCF